MDTAVVWFRDDLRVTDNPTLADAVNQATKVLPIYVYDPRRYGQTQYGTQKIGGFRAQFRHESVSDLRNSLQDLGGDLFVRSGHVEDVIPKLVREVDADAVFAQTKPATEELEREHLVRESLPSDVSLKRRWTHTLYHINDLPEEYHNINDTFTPWRKTVEQQSSVRDSIPVPKVVNTPRIDSGDLQSPTELDIEPQKIDNRTVLEFTGGETAAKRRLDKYFWEGDHLREYKQTRNGMLGANYSSKFSPWLAAGCISPRWIHGEIEKYENQRVSNEDTYWLVFELLWRDFFQFQFVKHGADFFMPGGIRNVDKPWKQDKQQFTQWKNGETGIPFIDANMRELNQTGYMSNRGRQNVASFLVDGLQIDWRWGAAYFEEQLVDYDVASNWGNWAYQAGVGNDSRDNYFNVLTQAERYDSDAEYIKTWIPELSELPAEYAHQPWDMTKEQQVTHNIELGIDYPRPMIDLEERYRSI